MISNPVSQDTYNPFAEDDGDDLPIEQVREYLVSVGIDPATVREKLRKRLAQMEADADQQVYDAERSE